MVMDKIIVRMRGGLGNQLFIIAFAYKIATEQHKHVEMVLDIREYEKYKVRNFELLNMLEDGTIRFYDKDIDYSVKYEITRKAYHLLQKFIPSQKKMSKSLSKNGCYYSKRSAQGYCISNKKDVYIYGYFQDAIMAFEAKNTLLSHLKLPIVNKYSIDASQKYLAVSIRCGKDYLSQGWPICSSGYFNSAINEIITEKYMKQNINILIFSDDIRVAKQMCGITQKDVITKYIEGLSAPEQLSLMSKCDDFVLSNSSFSWWGAFLGVKMDSIIIVPDVWYDTRENTSKTLITYKNIRIRKIHT
jgi:hypothetical protein